MEVGLAAERELIAKRAAKEIKPGMVVNLGIGIPTLVANYLPSDYGVMFHAENGILGTGPAPERGLEDPELCNAGGIPVTIVPRASYFDSALAFGIIRRGLVDVTILGALEVSLGGDLANWLVPGKKVPGIGGGMDLAQKAKRVIVVMNHCAKDGSSKIVSECSLPLTGKAVVDLIITERAVIEIIDGEAHLKEVMAPFTVEQVLQTTPRLIVGEIMGA